MKEAGLGSHLFYIGGAILGSRAGFSELGELRPWSDDKPFRETASLLAQQYRWINRQGALRRNPRSQQPQQEHT